MPKIVEHREMALRRIIRDALALDPLITMQALERVVEKKINRPIDNAYLVKLVAKVRKQVITEVERSTASSRIAEIKESYRTIIEELRRLAYAETTPPNERRKCLDSVARIQDMQAKLEMDFGIFTRQLGSVNIDHRLKPMDEKTLIDVTATFKAWSLPPQPRKIERSEAKTIDVTPNTNDQPKQQPEPKPEPTRTIATTIGAGLVTAE